MRLDQDGKHLPVGEAIFTISETSHTLNRPTPKLC
jgi:hypothetical protein